MSTEMKRWMKLFEGTGALQEGSDAASSLKADFPNIETRTAGDYVGYILARFPDTQDRTGIKRVRARGYRAETFQSEANDGTWFRVWPTVQESDERPQGAPPEDVKPDSEAPTTPATRQMVVSVGVTYDPDIVDRDRIRYYFEDDIEYDGGGYDFTTGLRDMVFYDTIENVDLAAIKKGVRNIRRWKGVSGASWSVEPEYDEDLDGEMEDPALPRPLPESVEDDGIRIAVDEIVTVYYSFTGTAEEADQLIARVNAGEIDIEEDPRCGFDGDNDDSRSRSNARVV